MRRPRPRTVLVLALLLWTAVIAAAIIPLLGKEVDDGTLTATPLPPTTCPGLEIGVNATLAFENNAQRRATTVEAIDDEIGAGLVRDSLLWNRVEPEEGERDWSGPDGVVEELRAAGIEPLMSVLGSPTWANGVSESTPNHYLYVPPRGPALDAWLDQYSDFLAEAVARYRGVVRKWEIWNEPNLVDFWLPHPDPIAYREVYERLRATILSVDPQAEISVGGLATFSVAANPNVSGHAFLRSLMRTGTPLDYVAIHPYTTDEHPPDVHVDGENNFDDIERMHEQLVRAGERAPIWVTEWGWQSDVVGETLQAHYVEVSLRLLESRWPFVRVATYFADHDRPPAFTQGLLDEDLEPKPAALSFRTQAERLAARCRTSGARR